MAQILTGPTIGQQRAQQIGSPILQSLQNLADMQMQNIQKQRQRQNTLAGLSGLVDPEQAQLLSFLPENVLRTVLPGLQRQQQTQQTLEQFRQQRGIAPTQPQEVTTADPTVPETTGVPDTPAERTSDDALAARAFEDAFLLSGGDTRAALRAESDERKRIQKDRLAKEAKEERREVFDVKTTAKALERAEVKANEAADRAEAFQASADNYDDVIKVLKTGKTVTGIPFKILERFGLDKAGASSETQVVNKLLAAEPIRALKTLPKGATRLSKVFDTLKDMHGSLVNTQDGLETIARLKKAEANAAALIENKYIDKLEEFRQKKKAPPFTLRKQVINSLSKDLNKFGAEMQYIISENIEKSGAPLDEFKFGEKVIADDGSGQVFVKRKVAGRPAWVAFERS